MKKSLLLIGSLFLITQVTFAQLDYYPRTTLAEDITATWCGYCPDVYAGLDVAHGIFDWSEFVSVRYYATSGDYGTPEIDNAINYYGVDSYPTTVFNGEQIVVGGGDAMATGLPFIAFIESYYFTAAPVKMTVDEFNPQTGAITATVEMYSNDYAITDGMLRLVLIENNITGQHTHVTRDIITETFSLTDAGSSYITNAGFEMDPGFNSDNLYAVAFVQLESKEIIQVASSFPQPEYKGRIVFEGEQIIIGPSDGTINTDEFQLVNVALQETFNVAIVLDEGPANTMVTFCDENDNCYPSNTNVTLNSEEDMAYHANIMPGGSGMIKFHFEVTSENTTSPITIRFTYLSDDIQMLLVDDDGGEPFEEYFTSALDALSISYGIWDLSASKLSADLIPVFDQIIWNIGWAFPSLDEMDRDFLRQYLDAGGNLFLSGQDIGWDLNDNDDNIDLDFYNNYLHADYIADDANFYDLAGVVGDPISDEIDLHIQGGDGANNQEYPSRIAAFDDAAVELFHYTNNNSAAAVRAIHPGSEARLVYFAFGYEAIDNPADRELTMARIVSWLMEGGGNFVPIITGVTSPVVLMAQESWEVTLDVLQVMDLDNNYPDAFTLEVLEGENYTVVGTTVLPDPQFVGDLPINVRVSDGIDWSVPYAIPALVYLPGDANFDANVDVLDIVGLVNIILGINQPTSLILLAGDLSGDGSINVLDIIQIINIIIHGRTNTIGSVSSGIITVTDNRLILSADGPVAGLQLELTGDPDAIQWQLPAGWEVYCSNDKVVMFSSDASALFNSVLASFAGDLRVNTGLIGSWDGSSASVEISYQPHEHGISRIYPNPFNPVTTIDYSLDQTDFVQLSVYNLTGQEVAQLVPAGTMQDAGEYSITWQADNYPSGVYLVRLHRGGISEVQRVLLLK